MTIESAVEFFEELIWSASMDIEYARENGDTAMEEIAVKKLDAYMIAVKRLKGDAE